ncbi:unnamed protein product [Rotaria sp. Silwood2]|nr:unnamed protein product [Rotaria sp. Silwood2]CAF3869909.1 unnamed protein product [Rotaria sp. Silwood2]
MPIFDVKNNIVQEPLSDALSIPVPTRVSQNKIQSNNAIITLPREPSVVNNHSEPIETVQQLNALSSTEPTTSFPVVNEPTEKKFKQEQPQQQIIQRSTSHLDTSELPKHSKTMIGEAVVISRSTMNRNDPRCLKNHYTSSFRPNRSIVEHNGKQFIVEFAQRAECRYVQYMDEKTNQMRYFEVVDCMPSTIIRPYRYKSQPLSRNDTPRLDHRSNQCLALQQIPSDRSQAVTPSSFIDKRDLKSSSFGLHIPTYSDYNESPTTTYSLDSGEETEAINNQRIDRILRSSGIWSDYKQPYPFLFSNHNTTVFLNGAIGRYDLPTPYNPFVRSLYPSDYHHCRKQCTLNNCAEPIM